LTKPATANKPATFHHISRVSDLQKRIIAALPDADSPALTVADIFAKLDIRPTPSARAVMSRSLVRLESRGLIQRWDAMWHPGLGGGRRTLQGNGSLWTRHRAPFGAAA
jgi:hypothetical protein